MVKDHHIPESDDSPSFQIGHDFVVEDRIMGRAGVEEHADWMEGGILDDQRQRVSDVMTMTQRIAPFELSFFELFFWIGSSEPVEIEGDGVCIDQECRRPSEKTKQELLLAKKKLKEEENGKEPDRNRKKRDKKRRIA